MSINTILNDYRIQRQYREAKRNQYLRRFEVLRQNFNQTSNNQQPTKQFQNQLNHNHPEHSQIKQVHEVHQEKLQNHHHQHFETHQHQRTHLAQTISGEEESLLEENNNLKKELVEVETKQRERLLGFKKEIESTKLKYLNEIQNLSQSAKQSKDQIEAKAVKIKTQTEQAVKKNEEIQQVNQQIAKEIEEGNSLMGTYATEIKKEYGEKIMEFQKIFMSSNQKILAMEKQFNEDQFVENTLKNEELLKSIQQNASKAQEASKILEDYRALLEGKKEILVEINSNVAMKERQIEKMVQLEGKIKMIMDKMNAEKKVYLAQNNKMANELLEIKNLLMGAMNEAQ